MRQGSAARRIYCKPDISSDRGPVFILSWLQACNSLGASQSVRWQTGSPVIGPDYTWSGRPTQQRNNHSHVRTIIKDPRSPLPKNSTHHTDSASPCIISQDVGVYIHTLCTMNDPKQPQNSHCNIQNKSHKFIFRRPARLLLAGQNDVSA